MASVNILYSKAIDSYYIGSCKDLATRIHLHENMLLERSFTKRADDWEIFFVSEDLEYGQA